MKRPQLPILLCLLGLSSNAQAHLVSTGLGPVYDGLGHFFLSLDTLLPLVALLLLAVPGGVRRGRLGFFITPAAWGMGAMAGMAGDGLGFSAVMSFIPAVVLLMAGSLIALDAQGRLSTFLLAVGAFVLGLAEAGALLGMPNAGRVLLGSFTGLLLIASLVPALALALVQGAAWRRVVLRVGGSWLAGIGLLWLGWLLRQGALA